jgi:hypothetical protein
VKLLDVGARIEDEPEKGFRRGQAGTIVETLAPGVFEVEFCDFEGEHLPRLPCLKATSCFFTTSPPRPSLNLTLGFRSKSRIVAEVDE